MAKAASRKPSPRKKRATGKSETFQARVDYVAKALVRGSWGAKFDACFENHDSNHLVAVVMLRAEKNPDLKAAIMASFGVDSWEAVPWHDVAAPFAGMSARQIGVQAKEVQARAKAEFDALYKDPNLLMSIS